MMSPWGLTSCLVSGILITACLGDNFFNVIQNGTGDSGRSSITLTISSLESMLTDQLIAYTFPPHVDHYTINSIFIGMEVFLAIVKNINTVIIWPNTPAIFAAGNIFCRKRGKQYSCFCFVLFFKFANSNLYSSACFTDFHVCLVSFFKPSWSNTALTKTQWECFHLHYASVLVLVTYANAARKYFSPLVHNKEMKHL